MNTVNAIVSAPGRDTQAVLAAEALRHVASVREIPIHTQIRTGHAVLGEIDASAPLLLLVGDVEIADAPKAERVEKLSLDEVLDDPNAALARLLPARSLADSTAKMATAKQAAQSIVAITSCPTGIAHTFMAAEGLQQAGKALGMALRVETQGSVGAQNTLSDAEIAAADVVIIAADREVDLSRFNGKRVFRSGTKPAINDGQALIRKALAEAQLQGGAPGSASGTTTPTASASGGTRAGPYKHLMTGVSFMLPFITAGGLLIALSFALGGIYAFKDSNAGTLSYALFQIGSKGGFALIVPALAGYIAFSIADRPGIAPGMIGGMIANQLGAGFLGGIVAGFIAGYGVAALNRYIRLPRNLEGLKPVLILPVLGTLLVGLLMMFVVGGPVAEALEWMTNALRSLQGSSAILLGLIIGAMMAFDMGGPVNKAAYAFSTGLIASQVYTPMAAAMMAGMTAPLGVALATRVFANRFTAEERQAGGAAAVLGLAFVTEGAIPFAARDPLRVIPSLVVGSAIAGAISMGVGAELKVPHGGVFVLPIPNAVTHLGGYLLALVAGTVITTLMLGLLKKPIAASTDKKAQDAPAA